MARLDEPPMSRPSRQPGLKGYSPGSGDLVQGARLVGIHSSSQRDTIGKELAEDRERERGELLRQPGVVDHGSIDTSRRAWAVKQSDHPATVIDQALGDRFEVCLDRTAAADQKHGEARLDHRDRAVLEVGDRPRASEHIARLSELQCYFLRGREVEAASKNDRAWTAKRRHQLLEIRFGLQRARDTGG